MKKLIIITLVFLGVLLIQAPVLAEDSIELPEAGITPESPFYFLDKAGESIRDFFTFNLEAKARLQVKYAAERLAEIRVMIKEKGIEAKGIKVAQARLESNVARAGEIIEKQKAKGKDVSGFAGEIVDSFHSQRLAAKEIFNQAKEEFLTKKRELHQLLVEAIENGDEAEQARIRAELGAIEAEKDEAEAKKDETITVLEQQKERLRNELKERKRQEDDARDQAEEAKEAEEEAEEETEELQQRIREEEAKRNRGGNGNGQSLQQLEQAQERVEEQRKQAEEKRKEAQNKLREMNK